MNRTILFLDIATNTGWCEGVPGQKPAYGSVLLAPDGSDTPAKGAGLFKFLANRMQAFKPHTFVYEAPRNPNQMIGRTNAKTIRTLIGLPFVAETAAYLCGVYDIREAEASSIRSFMLPLAKGEKRGKLAAGDLKKLIFNRVVDLGFEPKNSDESDAIAGWLFACSKVAPDVKPYAFPSIGRPGSEATPQPWGNF